MIDGGAPEVLLQTVVIALKSMVWTSVVVILLLYIFGVVFTQGVIDHCGMNDDCVDDAGITLLMRFGRIDRSLLSLFEALGAPGGSDGRCISGHGRPDGGLKLGWPVD